MKKRTVIRLISFCGGVALAAIGFACKAEQKAARYRIQTETAYCHMLDRLNESTGNISVLLQKAAYTTSPASMSGLAAQLLSESQSAKTALSQLPAGGNELATLNRFLSQVGNYAVSVSQKAIGGEQPGETYEKNAAALRRTAQTVCEAVNDSAIMYNDPEQWRREIDRKLEEEIPVDSFAGAAAKLEESLTEYPTLVYDGPYSDHILEKEPLMLKDKPVVSEEEAKKIAAVIAGCDENALTFDTDVDGKIPAYRFGGGNVTVSISKQGGYAVFMRRSRTVEAGDTGYEKLLKAAKRYLAEIGLTGFKETYYFTDEGVCVINFAFVDGKTVCYPDLVKVGVATDTGEIMLLETSGYLTNHTDRAFLPPAVSEEQAATALHRKLTVTGTSLALIPTDGGGEIRCYEFLCKTEEDREILVYVDAATGIERDLLLLLKSDGGTLTK